MSTDNWQPIDTAPKDGTRILVFNGTLHIACWTTNKLFPEGVWGDERWFLVPKMGPTHWQPLPPPPTPPREPDGEGL